MDVKLEESWKQVLENEFKKPYFKELKEFLVAEKNQYKVFPLGSKIFEAFNKTPFDKVKVVLIGQDPYHDDGQAEGMSFSVPLGVKPPPSLKNIYKELVTDVGFKTVSHGHLSYWAEQGVLLLNSVLTVRAHQAGSHRNKGWEVFTDQIIRDLSAQKNKLVFLLWGNYAKQKAELIDGEKHLILTSAHPSPFSAATGFFGCKHFSKTNTYLQSNSISPIDWQLPSYQLID